MPNIPAISQTRSWYRPSRPSIMITKSHTRIVHEFEWQRPDYHLSTRIELLLFNMPIAKWIFTLLITTTFGRQTIERFCVQNENQLMPQTSYHPWNEVAEGNSAILKSRQPLRFYTELKCSDQCLDTSLSNLSSRQCLDQFSHVRVLH